MPRINPPRERQPSLFRVPTYSVRHVHLSRQTLASDNLWVLSFLSAASSPEKPKHAQYRIFQMPQQFWQGQLARKNINPCQHGKMKQHCQRPVSLFTVAVQTMVCSHCGINSQSFQLHFFVLFFYSNSLWEKNKHGAVAGINLVPSRTACPLRHAHVYMPSDCRNAMFAAHGVFACSRELFIQL